MIFTLGVLLFGTIQIIPQMLQEVFFYTPYIAGLALTVGGVATIFAMPIAGVLTPKFDARALLAPAFLMQAFGFWFYSGLNTNAGFWDAAFGRLLMSIGLPFVFIPINTVAYAGIRPQDTNKASAMLNFFRNLGGAFGISLIQTGLARREQFHQARISEASNPYNDAFVNTLQALQNITGSSEAALAEIYQQIQRQAAMLAYGDVYYALALAALCVIPFILFIRGGDGSTGGATRLSKALPNKVAA